MHGARVRAPVRSVALVRGGLILRAVIASSLLVLLIGGGFAVLLVTIGELRDAGRQASQSREELSAADSLEKLVIDLETGQRGFVITRQERFLQPWSAARAAFPVEARRLVRLANAPVQKRRARRIAAAVTAYVREYSVPLIDAARRDEPSARSVAATAEGKRLVDALRAQFDRFARTERAVITRRQNSADSDARRAIVMATAGLGASVLLILIVAGYMARAMVLPVRRTSDMAGRLAEGDLAVRLPETGIGEIGALERAFNSMGSSLETSRDELARLLAEQAALRRVATLVAQAVPPPEVFESVTREVGLLSGADLARMERYESDGTVTGVAGWSRDRDAELAVGTRFPLEGLSIAARVRETGGPARVDSFAEASGPIAQEARALGIRSSVGCPIVVEGRLWGVIAASSRREASFPTDTESQIAEFTELVATAIANAESRAEVTASRARVVVAGDETRRRIERDLHDGAQQRLIHAVITLKLARRALGDTDGQAAELLDEALEHAERANEELRELAHGILPAILTRGGLGGALEALVSRIDLPVSVDVPARRLPPALEATAYFIAAEALTNVVKHAGATSAGVKAVVDGNALHLEIRDDGVGGAQVEGSSGLLGLQDRAAAVNGRLDVESPPGGGTLVGATLPVAR
jgi:signal transduction histidine kinase